MRRHLTATRLGLSLTSLAVHSVASRDRPDQPPAAPPGQTQAPALPASGGLPEYGPAKGTLVIVGGGVIGGSSAGATIQGDYLVRGAVAGPDTMMTPEEEHGFAFLRRSASDQYSKTRLYQPRETLYFVLSAGDIYDMKARRVIELGIESTAAVARQQQQDRVAVCA
jgi:hypothetical protein